MSRILIFCILAFATPQVFACKCAVGSSLLDYLRADLILVGVPIKIRIKEKVEFESISSPVVFQVKNILKGKTGDVSTLEVKRKKDVNGKCQSFLSDSKKTYLIFASGKAGSKGFTLLSDCYASSYEVNDQGFAVLNSGQKVKVMDLDSEISVAFGISLSEIKIIAAGIRTGVSRAEVETIFKIRDGGLQNSSVTRYFEPPNLMIEVPFDRTGGPFSESNKVSGSLKVSEGSRHYD